MRISEGSAERARAANTPKSVSAIRMYGLLYALVIKLCLIAGWPGPRPSTTGPAGTGSDAGQCSRGNPHAAISCLDLMDSR
jgi:hypothetical protein